MRTKEHTEFYDIRTQRHTQRQTQTETQTPQQAQHPEFLAQSRRNCISSSKSNLGPRELIWNTYQFEGKENSEESSVDVQYSLLKVGQVSLDLKLFRNVHRNVTSE